LDFQAAFDNISHTYLFQILQAYGFSEAFQERIKSMYEGATAAIQINGNISSTIPVKLNTTRVPAKYATICVVLKSPPMYA
jgi:hypothetical protein